MIITGFTELDFMNNVIIKEKNDYLEIKCKNGLWSVSCANKVRAFETAQYYFAQYWEDGEYNEPQRIPSFDDDLPSDDLDIPKRANRSNFME